MTKTNSSALIVPPPGASTNAPPSDIRDIRAPVDIPATWFWVAVALGAAVAIALAWWVIRRWRRKQPASKPVPVVPPHERARKRLEAALKLIDDPKLFCTEVSDALRVYLEDRFGLHAPERATDEFLFELQATAELSFSHKQLLAGFLNRCDLVKFAKHEPAQTALRDLHEAALKLVSETEPPLIPKTGETLTSAEPITKA
ncbi:MAG: DUF4381 family protein [Pedosphaera sp.]|nr:DUF4381 family protein [Pedosphaera sp.]